MPFGRVFGGETIPVGGIVIGQERLNDLVAATTAAAAAAAAVVVVVQPIQHLVAQECQLLSVLDRPTASTELTASTAPLHELQKCLAGFLLPWLLAVVVVCHY